MARRRAAVRKATLTSTNTAAAATAVPERSPGGRNEQSMVVCDPSDPFIGVATSPR
ncbi:hypothetical protein [Streptomyces scopuliridis]|uniref:hypothetical protein n=1 Tax=Streptomyces scopuliridis TaxID=452529 RepID=UPI003673E4E5